MARCTDADEGRRHTPRETGYTLVELATVVVILGVLASLGIPRTRTAVARARAAALVNEVRTVRSAAFDYMVDHNAWPPPSESGQVPEGLEEYLPEGFSFRRPRARLNFVNVATTGAAEWGEQVGLGVSIEDDPRLEEALRRIMAADDADDGEEGGGVKLWIIGEDGPTGPDAGGPDPSGGGLAGTGGGPGQPGRGSPTHGRPEGQGNVLPLPSLLDRARPHR